MCPALPSVTWPSNIITAMGGWLEGPTVIFVEVPSRLWIRHWAHPSNLDVATVNQSVDQLRLIDNPFILSVTFLGRTRSSVPKIKIPPPCFLFLMAENNCFLSCDVNKLRGYLSFAFTKSEWKMKIIGWLISDRKDRICCFWPTLKSVIR